MTDDETQATIHTTAEAAEAAAIPRCHEVHADPERGNAGGGLTEGVALGPVEDKSPAQWAYERLILYIRNFEQGLDSEHEIAIGFAGTEAGVMRIEGLGFFDPDIITFFGTDTAGTKTQLVQHVSQLSVMLRALPRQPDRPEPVRIGFRLARDLNEG